jgi:very-short-patch-repair endonuclease
MSAPAASAPPPPGWPVAFRGSAAIAAGLVTAKMLRGPRYVRVFPDTYVRRGEELDLRLRSLAAYRYVAGRGVIAGHSAAVLLGADCAPEDAPAEVMVPGGGQREHPGLLVHRGALDADEVRPCRGVVVTSPVQTAYTLGRRPELVDAVVAIDALANACRFDPADVLVHAQRRPGARGLRDLRRAVALADRRAGSPMESRLRLILVLGGLPAPEVQFPVQDEARRRVVWLDLAYPEQRIGIEYEGADHTRPERVLLDAGRYTRLVDAGWRIYRFTKYQVYAEPDEIVATIGRALAAG